MSDGFQHAIAGGQGNLVISQLQSPNFSQAGETGWAILKNGDAYFFNITAEGSITANTMIVSGSGEGVFSYSGTPATGNLVATAGIESAGNDTYGNKYLAGTSSYGSGIASSVTAGGVTFYTGSLSAGWTSLATINYDAALSGLFVAAGQVQFNAALVTMDGVLSVDGNTNLAFLGVSGGLATYNQAAQLYDGAEIGNGLTVTGGLTVDTITASGAVTVTGGLLEAEDGLTVGGNINANTSVLNIANGSIDLNMASPPNYPTSGKTLAQTQACLDGLIGSMINRQLIA